MPAWRHSPLLRDLSTLDAKTWRRFGDFLDAPYHNTAEQPRQVFAFLTPYHPGFRDPACTREALHAHLFGPGTPDHRLRNASTRLHGLWKRFAAVEALEAAPEWTPWLTLRWMRRQGAREAALDLIRSWKRIQDKGQGLADERPLLKGLLARAESGLENERHRDNQARVRDWLTRPENLAPLVDYLALTLLNDATVRLSLERIHGPVDEPSPLLEGLLPELLRFAELGEPYQRALWHAWRVLRADEDEDLERLSALLPGLEGLGNEEYLHLHDIATNQWAWRYRHGNVDAYRRLYRLDRACFRPPPEGKGMVPGPVRLLSLSCQAATFGDPDWGAALIREVGPALPDDIRDSIVAEAWMAWHAVQGRYDEAMEQYAAVDQKAHSTQALSARQWLAWCYYQTGDFAALDALADSARKYLEYHGELNANRRTMFRRFFRHLLALAKARLDPDPSAWERVAEAVRAERECALLYWLRREVDGGNA